MTVSTFEESQYQRVSNLRDRADQLDLRVKELKDIDKAAYHDLRNVMWVVYGLLSQFNNLSVYRRHSPYNLPISNKVFDEAMAFIGVTLDFVENALEIAEDGC